MDFSYNDFLIKTLGDSSYISPFQFSTDSSENMAGFESDVRRVPYRSLLGEESKHDPKLSFELAGPRKNLFFKASETTAAIVTCGGLCPGMNNVVRSIVMHLHYGYKIKRIYGIRYGFRGLVPEYGDKPLILTPDVVKFVHERGGTFLGSSRGDQDAKTMVDTLKSLGVNCLFTIGGDGTFRGAHKIAQEIERQKLKISVIGIPKTIDNDVQFIDKTFGFETAVAEAARAIRSAHVEAIDAPNGIGVVKLMGRHSGYVAAYAALSLREVNLVLIPEQKFDIQALFRYCKERIETRGHVLIVVAEGAGQDLFEKSTQTDASGNVKLHDIGVYLSDQIKKYFKSISMEVNLKYIDPSYMIRSIPAIPTDSAFTGFLGQYAADAAMAGKTDCAIGYWKGFYTHLPFNLATSSRKVVSLEGEIWNGVLRATGQPKELL